MPTTKHTHMCDCERQTETLPPDIAQTKDYWPIVASVNSSIVTSSFEAQKELAVIRRCAQLRSFN